MRKRLFARFTGRVQGVGFRATCRRLASRHELTGWVRNERDGGVRLEAQGEEEALRDFLDQLPGTSAGKGIADSELSWAPPRSDEADFSIRRV